MKGYLQRIVFQAMPGHAPRVHPLVGSLSPVANQDMPPEIFSQESVMAKPQGSATSVASLHTSPLHAGCDLPESLPQKRGGKQPPPVAPEINGMPSRSVVFEPLLNTVEIEVPCGPPQVHETFVEREVLARQSRPETVKRFPKKAPPSQSMLPGEVSRELRARETITAFSAEARQIPQITGFRGAAERPQAPDEIQINIGRIELTATATVPQRPAAPVRKPLNLDEYLRRRNGRNG